MNDTLCLGKPIFVGDVPERKLVVQEMGCGNRQMIRPPDRHNNPPSQDCRDYSTLPRQKQGYTLCPCHRSRTRRLWGIASGDLVRFIHRRHGALTGYAV